jgi:hypothetical protein
MPATAATQPYAAALHHSLIKFKFCPALPTLNYHFPTSFFTAYTKLLSKVKHEFFKSLLGVIPLS